MLTPGESIRLDKIEQMVTAMFNRICTDRPPEPSGLDVFQARQLAQQLLAQPNPGRKRNEQKNSSGN